MKFCMLIPVKFLCCNAAILKLFLVNDLIKDSIINERFVNYFSHTNEPAINN